MNIRPIIKRALRQLGYDVRQYNTLNSAVARRTQLLRQHDIDLVFDVGANAGQYAQDIRANGYNGRIVSFEPLSATYKRLQELASKDSKWTAVNKALGASSGVATINIAANDECSSLMDLSEGFEQNAPAFAYVGREEVSVSKLDDVFCEFTKQTDRVFLKIDAQGYEQQILEGATEVLPGILGVQLEMSLVQIYEGAPLMDEMIRQLRGHGYTLMSLEPLLVNAESGQQRQADGIFFRSTVT